MITKTYKCVYNPYILSVVINEKVVRIKFSTDYISARGGKLSSYTTSVSSIQDAIEHSKNFGEKGKSLLWLDSQSGVPEVSDVEAVEAAAEVSMDVHEEVTTYEEAKAVLLGSPYNCAIQAVCTPNRLLSCAAKNNVSFPNLVIE